MSKAASREFVRRRPGVQLATAEKDNESTFHRGATAAKFGMFDVEERHVLIE
jgi:hypothetical protein